MVDRRLFSYEHLPKGLMRETSREFRDALIVAEDGWDISVSGLSAVIGYVADMDVWAPASARSEVRACLVKLAQAFTELVSPSFADPEPFLRLMLEAKDCAVRAVVLSQLWWSEYGGEPAWINEDPDGVIEEGT